MNTEQSKLYERIQAFPLNEPGVLFPFVVRLASDHGWSRAYAERVIEEYRKFVFLAKTAGHPVCPSDQVDQAWHLHLTFTQSYWSEFCPDVLEGPLHHTPSAGGANEQQEYRIRYSRTLASYRELIDAEPPEDIWPTPQIRFREGTRYRRVETGKYVMVPRKVVIVVLLVSGLGLGFSFARWLVAGGETFGMGGGAAPLALNCLGVITAFVGGHLFRGILRRSTRKPVDADADLDLYEAAYLARGPSGAVHAALLHLAGRGNVGLDAKTGEVTRGDALAPPYLPLEGDIHSALPCGTAVPAEYLRGYTLTALPEIATKLRERGLLVSEFSRDLGQFVPLFAVLAGGVTGLILFGVRDPEDWGPCYLVAVGLAFLFLFSFMPLHRSLLGDRVLERLQKDSRHLHARAEADFGGRTPLLATTIAAALFGLGALAETDPSRKALEGGSNMASGCG